MINKDFDDDEISIDLMELLGIVFRKLHVILLIGIFFASIAFAGTKLLITPTYTSTTKMYILSRQSGEGMVTYTDLVTGSYLTKDYIELVTSRPVLEKVIDQLDLDTTPEKLKKTIRVEAPEDTRILAVTVENTDPQLAKDIADEVRKAVSVQIPQIMAVEAVNTIEEGNYPDSPSSPSTFKNTFIGGFLGCLLAMVIILIKYMLDDTIKTPEDVEKYLGLTVLASIPVKTSVKKEKGRKSSATKNRL